jgi:biotin carboxyl carrier protein
MKNSYQTKVNDVFNFEIDSEDLKTLDSVEVTNNSFHVLKDNKSFNATISKADYLNKSYEVIVNKNKYNVNIYNALDLLIKEMGFELGSTKKVNEIKAPMPGLILDINVKVGQEVSENDNILILEAMKMENVITAPRDGIIKSISINKGDAVDKNQLLIEFE